MHIHMLELASIISEKYAALLKHHGCSFGGRHHTATVLVLSVPRLPERDPFSCSYRMKTSAVMIKSVKHFLMECHQCFLR